MGSMASQITSLTIAYSIVYSEADHRKHQSSASLAFVRGIPRTNGQSVTRKRFPFDDVLIIRNCYFCWLFLVDFIRDNLPQVTELSFARVLHEVSALLLNGCMYSTIWKTIWSSCVAILCGSVTKAKQNKIVHILHRVCPSSQSILMTFGCTVHVSHILHSNGFAIRQQRSGETFFYHCPFVNIMMTSSNETSFRVTGPLCGEFTGPGDFPHKGQWRGALMFSLICAWINDWVNNREAGDLRRHRGHYDVNVMILFITLTHMWQYFMRIYLVATIGHSNSLSICIVNIFAVKLWQQCLNSGNIKIN